MNAKMRSLLRLALNRSVHSIVEERRATDWTKANDFLANLLKSEVLV